MENGCEAKYAVRPGGNYRRPGYYRTCGDPAIVREYLRCDCGHEEAMRACRVHFSMTEEPTCSICFFADGHMCPITIVKTEALAQ